MSENQLSDLYTKLKTQYQNPLENAAEIQRINAEIARRELEEEERRRKAQQGKEEPKEYNDKLGINQTEKELREWEKYKDRTKGKPAYEQVTDEKTGETKSNLTRKLDDFEERALIGKENNISGKGWYNNIQAEHLTGQRVPAGPSELADFLTDNKEAIMSGKPVAFSYLITDPKDPKQNHFCAGLAYLENGKIEFLYIDSNGDALRSAERNAITKALGPVEIKYIDGVALANGKFNKLSEAEAAKNPTQILRTQFDGHNCGMYSTETTRLMQAAIGDEKAIVQGLTKIKNIDPSEIRAKHTAQLHDIVAGKAIDRHADYRISEKTVHDQAKEIGKNIPNLKSQEFEKPSFAINLKNQPSKNNGPAISA